MLQENTREEIKITTIVKKIKIWRDIFLVNIKVKSK